MSTAGPNYTGTASTGAWAGGIAWALPENVTAEDNSYASVSLTNTASSILLKCQNFGFSVPSNSTIDGIVVTIRAKANSASKIRFEDIVLLDAAGATGGQDKAALTLINSTSEKAYGFGAADDTWNISPTVAMVNDADFGVVIRLLNIYIGTYTASIDSVTATIYYTEAPTISPKYMYYHRMRTG